MTEDEIAGEMEARLWDAAPLVPKPIFPLYAEFDYVRSCFVRVAVEHRVRTDARITLTLYVRSHRGVVRILDCFESTTEYTPHAD